MLQTQKRKPEYRLPDFYPFWMRESFDYFEEKFIAFIDGLYNIPSDVLRIINYALFPGRRIRPTLYCAFWKEIHHRFPSGIDLYPVYALELFHSASIIIDDIVDQDDARRNKDILYKNIDVEKATIISHLLVSLGYKLLSLSSKHVEQTKIWTDSYEMSAIGEFADVYRFCDLSVEEQSTKALEKTKGFFVFIGKSLKLYSDIHQDIVKLFEILGDSFQISNDVCDFVNADSSGRYSNGKMYKLNYSFLIPSLISRNLITEDIIRSPITYEDLRSIVLKAKKIFGTERDILGPPISMAVLRVKRLQLPSRLKELSVEFLNLLLNSKFWCHAHESSQD